MTAAMPKRCPYPAAIVEAPWRGSRESAVRDLARWMHESGYYHHLTEHYRCCPACGVPHDTRKIPPPMVPLTIRCASCCEEIPV
jgi:hypothetical protein